MPLAGRQDNVARWECRPRKSRHSYLNCDARDGLSRCDHCMTLGCGIVGVTPGSQMAVFPCQNDTYPTLPPVCAHYQLGSYRCFVRRGSVVRGFQYPAQFLHRDLLDCPSHPSPAYPPPSIPLSILRCGGLIGKVFVDALIGEGWISIGFFNNPMVTISLRHLVRFGVPCPAVTGARRHLIPDPGRSLPV